VRLPYGGCGGPETADEGATVTLRCMLDGLLLEGAFGADDPTLVAFDGDEPFAMEALEALYYEVVSATAEELVRLERGRYRLLRRAADFAYNAL
jgi:hypothetical protein